jgi:phosphatidylglycerophosphatase A
MKQINWFEKIIGSGFYTGYIPIASGTFGSLAAIVIFYFPGFERAYGNDPSQCTVDEIVGTWIALIALPKTILIAITSFLIWRVLDIVKPFPANASEKLPGGFGIMMDDVISGFYALILVHFIVYIFGVY